MDSPSKSIIDFINKKAKGTRFTSFETKDATLSLALRGFKNEPYTVYATSAPNDNDQVCVYIKTEKKSMMLPINNINYVVHYGKDECSAADLDQAKVILSSDENHICLFEWKI